MSATSNYFNRLPDELVEKIFSCFSNSPPLQPHNHVRSPPNTFYFDYSLQRPLLEENHAQLRRLAQVCQRFHRIIKSADFWERKCRKEHLLQPDESFPEDFIDYEKLYVYNPYHRSFNYIEEDQWRKDFYSSTRFELTPNGTSRLYDDFDRSMPCRVTSHMPAFYYQMNIPLFNPKLGSAYLNQLRPIIEFSICLSPRWDCAAQCTIDLVFSDRHRWRRHREFPQWSEQKWHRLIYRYANYEQMPSSVSLRVQARDSQFWAGFYGMKFAFTRLRLLLRSNVNVGNEEEEVVLEPKPDDELLPRPVPNEINDPTVKITGSTSHLDAEFGIHDEEDD